MMLNLLELLEAKLVGKLSAQERIILWFGGAWFFLVLFGYYILRPIREQISSTYGIQNLSWLFTATFVVMLVAIPLYSMLVGRFPRRKLVPRVYLFFIANLAAFWISLRETPEESRVWVARALFIWISVYGLFIVSFFWSVMGDMLSTDQGRRIFGVIFGAGTIGGMVGSQVAGRFVSLIGVNNLLLIPLMLLSIALCVYVGLERTYARLSLQDDPAKRGKATGGNPFAGFTAVVKSKYLLAICIYGLCLATCGTTVYFQQSEIVNVAFNSLGTDAARQEARTEYFANVDFYVSVLTLVLQFVVVGPLMRRVGLGWTLAIVPLAYIFGISALAMSPTIAVLAVITVTGRSVEYGIANPAREVLFTAVNREDRYKAKSFIDTVVRRSGDTLFGSLYHGLRESAGFAMTTLSWLVLPITVLWTFVALYIGKENVRRIANKSEAEDAQK
jgi:ATP:ADP antiporter, AAA family